MQPTPPPEADILTAAKADPRLLSAASGRYLGFWTQALVMVGLLAGLPMLVGSYTLHGVIISMIFLLPALGLNLIVGYTGLLSLAQGAFFGIGAYASALAAIHLNTPFYVNAVLAGLAAGLVALPLGIPALRLRATSFVMCTLGFVVISQTVAKNWISVTRGDMGLSGLPRPDLSVGLGPLSVTSTVGYYWLAVAVAVIGVAALYAIVASPAGRCLIAIRDNETLAEAVGIPTWRYKLIVFMISAAFAGVGGSLYAHYLTVVSPLTFSMYYSTTILIIVLGGGAGTIRGVVVGSLLFVALSEALRIAPELRMVMYGACLLLLVFWFPKGLEPMLARVLGPLASSRQ